MSVLLFCSSPKVLQTAQAIMDKWLPVTGGIPSIYLPTQPTLQSSKAISPNPTFKTCMRSGSSFASRLSHGCHPLCLACIALAMICFLGLFLNVNDGFDGNVWNALNGQENVLDQKSSNLFWQEGHINSIRRAQIISPTLCQGSEKNPQELT